MVWGVCRRVLGNFHDAEDAFQATFLVLVRRAHSITAPELLANWLHGVAFQTARKARAMAARRQARERLMAELPEPPRQEPGPWADLGPLLDQALRHLPERYRAVLVLCALEGKTRREAAQHLAVPEGTVAGWLARARALLARRLRRRGLVLSGGVLGGMLAQHAAGATAPASVVFATVKATCLASTGRVATGLVSAGAVTLTNEVIKAMFLTKLKAVVFVALVAVTGAGVWMLSAGSRGAHSAEPVLVLAAQPEEGPSVDPPAPEAPPERPVLDRHLLRWEQEMRKTQTLAANFTRTDKDKAFGSVRKYSGVVQYMKAVSGKGDPLNLFVLELREQGKADFAEKMICTGTQLYQFVPTAKEIRVFELPKPRQKVEFSFLASLFGGKVEEISRRYSLKLVKEDRWYIYVDIIPRQPDDRTDFIRARLVLSKETFLMRQLWLEQSNGNESTWDIPRMQSGALLDRRLFDAPKPPVGWRVVWP
jgi:TIGR03009 family protein